MTNGDLNPVVIKSQSGYAGWSQESTPERASRHLDFGENCAKVFSVDN